jgi:hypothetical protein
MSQSPIGQYALLLVAQQPFTVQSFANASESSFCKLVPLSYLAGHPLHPSQFPNDGEVWWMLNNRTRMLAQPGRVLVGRLEHAAAFDPRDPTKSSVQVAVDSVRDPERDEIAQVVAVGDSEIRTEQDIVESLRVRKTNVVCPQLFVHWKDKYIGPFRTVDAANDMLRLLPASTAKPTVFVYPQKAIQQYCIPQTVSDYVSKSSAPRRLTNEVQPVSFMYMHLEQLSEVRKQSPPSEIVLETVSSKLRRAAGECLARKAAKIFKQSLEDLERKAIDSQLPSDLIDAIQSRRSSVEADLHAMDELATKLLESGLLGEDRLERAKQSIAQDYLQKNGESLRAKLDTELNHLKREIEHLGRQRTSLDSEIKAQRTVRIAEVEAEIESKHRAHERELAEQRSAVKRDRAEVERLQEVLKNNLAEVTKSFRDAGDSVLNQFLTIEPLLGRLARPQANTDAAKEGPPASVSSLAARFHPRIRAEAVDRVNALPLSEAVFIDRVCAIAEDRELRFRRVDVERLHLSVKIGSITLLSGPSGTGKSSLATAYGEALRGQDTSQRASHHIVSVNPTWMDGRDLLGHLSASDRRFVPAESGLFEFLVGAHVEAEALRDDAGIFLALLDEINLSQVEHYFGEIMLALERQGYDRAIQLFSMEAASPECAFRDFGRLRLAQNVRFVGTMNEDETTRQLSNRFLDRANLIRLESRTVIADTNRGAPAGLDSGRAITQEDFDRWTIGQPLQAEIAEFFDHLRPILDRLDAPLSMRARNGIDRYIRASGGLLRQEQALDHQIAQRVLPKIRLVGSRAQSEAMAALRALLEAADFAAPESLGLIELMQLRMQDTLVDDA